MNEIESISKQTGISIKSLNWLNHPEWFHGTTIMDAENIMANGVDAMYNIGKGSDYGPGFYMMRTFEEAESYISGLPMIDPKTKELRKRNTWAVLRFEFNPFDMLFSGDKRYTYKNFPKFDEEFGRFALQNWLPNANHKEHSKYDVIWGVMSDSIPDRIASDFLIGDISYQEAIRAFLKSSSKKQLYIGNQMICSELMPIYEKEMK